MANLLQSSQVQSTCAPSFYQNYLSNIASRGQAEQAGAQYIGSQPLQNEAFQRAACTAGQFQPLINQGAGFLGQAAGQNITGATTPYLQAGTTASPLCAAKPYMSAASGLNLGAVAECYMNPYIKCQIQTMSDIGQRNIMQNLAPQATAAAVGSGQFGSQRGAQVLGQVEAQAEQCLNANIANLLASGYKCGLNAAIQKQSLLGNLGSVAATAQQAQNAANIQAGQTAMQAAAQQAQALQNAGAGLGTLGAQGQQVNLGCLNALATLGGQQQTILQNQQCYPLTTLSKLSTLLSGQTIPTKTTQTLCMPLLSTIGTVGSGLMGLVTPYF